MNQLSGYISPSKPTSARWLLLLTLVCAIGFVAAHYASHISDKTTHADAAPQPIGNLSDADTEDLLQHIDNALAAQAVAAAGIHKSKRWIDEALPLIDDGSLSARRLELADSASRAAEERINHARDELQVTRNVLIERSTHREH